MRDVRVLRTLEATAVLLFLIQAVRVLFSVLVGLVYDTIFAETMAFTTLGAIILCAIAALLTPLVTPRRSRRTMLFVTVPVVALARIPLTINQPTARLWSAILIIAAAGIHVTTLLRQRPRVLPTALLVAFAADQFLRAAGDTYDVSLRSWWLSVQVVLSLATCAAAWLAFSCSTDEEAVPTEGGMGIADGLALGALLFLETSLLGFPNALARWTGIDYAVVAPLLMGTTVLVTLSSTQIGGLLFVLLPLAGLVVGRAVGGALGLAGMLLAQYLLLLSPLSIAQPDRSERTGLVWALGMLFFLLLNFALAFAFTYPYTIPAFRGKGLYVLLVAAFVAGLPILFPPALPRELDSKVWHWLSGALVVILTVVFAWPPALDLKDTGPIGVGTYNIHYGYNTPWRFSLEEQARTIEESGADIVMLQEVDACRITSYGVDDALWLARRLGMQQVYGPALEGLSGVALLTRFPISEADTQHLTSQLEQTAIVRARVQVGEQPLDAYGVWLGLEPEERARQLDDALAYIGDASPAALGGDFNATPDSPTYARVRAADFDDPFIVGGFDPAPTSPAIEPAKRIDLVWARGLEVRGARVLDSLASDHRLVVVELALR